MKKFRRIICMMLALLTLVTLVACKEQQSEGEPTESGKQGVAYYAEYKGVKIKMGEAADEIIKALGEYRDRKEIGDCGGLGAQVKYSYPSIDVYVLESKTDGNIIDEISFRDDTVSTPEGVYIGMSASEAKEILGEPTAERETNFEYGNGKYYLVITVQDGVVNKINYQS